MRKWWARYFYRARIFWPDRWQAYESPFSLATPVTR
jgi:hypothetical protein